MQENTRFLNSILEQLGIDPKTFSWHKLANCQNMKINDFFDKYEAKNKNWARQIDEICVHCPVTKECFLTGIENKETGVWGGFYLDRGEVDPIKNAHKTEKMVKDLSARIYD